MEHKFGGGRRLAARYAQDCAWQRHELHREPLPRRVDHAVGRLTGYGQPDEFRDRSTQRVVKCEHKLFAVFGHFALAYVQQLTGLAICRSFYAGSQPSEKESAYLDVVVFYSTGRYACIYYIIISDYKCQFEGYKHFSRT